MIYDFLLWSGSPTLNLAPLGIISVPEHREPLLPHTGLYEWAMMIGKENREGLVRHLSNMGISRWTIVSPDEYYRIMEC
jgi:hypothetical protein